LPLQLSAVVGALALSQINLGRGFLVVLAAAFLFNLISACQDVATDGLAVHILDTRERGLANGIQVGAYRIGMILGGGLLQSASRLFYVFGAQGIGGLALLTLMMDASGPEHACTDYTLFACAIVFTMALANFTSAAIADAARCGCNRSGRRLERIAAAANFR
jgi:hypothetical protein